MTTSPSPQAGEQVWPIGKKAAIYSCAVVCLLGAFDTIDRQIVAAVFPFIKEEWGLTDTELGMFATIVSVAVSVLVVPSAYLIDRWSRTKMISLMGLIWTVALGGCAMATGFWAMFVARFFVGAGQAGYNPAAHALLAAQFPEQRRSSVIAIYHFFIAIGAPLGLVIGAFIATHWGWRYALGIVAVPSLILSIMAWFIRDYKSVDVVDNNPTATAGGAAKKVPFGVQIGRMLRTPSLLCVFIGAIGMQMYTGAIVNWMPTYFMREGGLSVTHASTLASVAMLSGICSALFVGPVLDWAKRKRTNGTPIVMAVSLGINAVLVTTAYAVLPAGSTAQILLITLAGLFGGTFLTGGPMVLIELTHPGARATVFSVLIFCQNIFGFACGPLVVGSISDHFELGTALTVLAAITFVAVIAYIVCVFTYNKDAAKVQAVELEFANN